MTAACIELEGRGGVPGCLPVTVPGDGAFGGLEDIEVKGERRRGKMRVALREIQGNWECVKKQVFCTFMFCNLFIIRWLDFLLRTFLTEDVWELRV